MKLSVLIREVSLCNGWQAMQKSMADQNEVNKMSVEYSWTHTPASLSHQGAGILRRREQKDCKSQRSERTSIKQYLLDMTGPHSIHELTAAVPACRRPSKEQASQHSSMDGEGLGRGLWAQIPNWGTIHSWRHLESGSQLSLRMWHLVGQPLSNGWLHTMSTCAVQTEFYRLLKNNKRKSSWEGLEMSGVDLGGVRGRSEGWIWSKYFYEILKELKYIKIVRNIMKISLFFYFWST